MKVIIAENSSLMRERLKLFFTGFRESTLIEQASTIDELYNKILVINPDMILCDVNFTSNERVFDKIKEMSPDTEIVMLSNYDFKTYMNNTKADAYFDISMEIDDFVDYFKKFTQKETNNFEFYRAEV